MCAAGCAVAASDAARMLSTRRMLPPTLLSHMAISSSGCCMMIPAFEQPNARLHLLPEAAATQERRLEAVRCKPLLGTGLGTRLRLGAPHRPPHDGPQTAVTAPRKATPPRGGAGYGWPVPRGPRPPSWSAPHAPRGRLVLAAAVDAAPPCHHPGA